MDSLPKLTFHPLTPERWPDLENLFGERGTCGGCWCMTWRLKRAEFDKGKGQPNKRAFRQVVEGGAPPGILSYAEDEPIGWCAVAPRDVYIRLGGSRVLAPVDDQPVWSISCLFVAKPYRRSGVSMRLIRAAADYALANGARVVEGYPVEPYGADMPGAFAWTGLPSAFLQAGFSEVLRRSKTRPIMRLECEPPAPKRARRVRSAKKSEPDA